MKRHGWCLTVKSIGIGWTHGKEDGNDQQKVHVARDEKVKIVKNGKPVIDSGYGRWRARAVNRIVAWTFFA